jgi:hypothetical protein
MDGIPSVAPEDDQASLSVTQGFYAKKESEVEYDSESAASIQQSETESMKEESKVEEEIITPEVQLALDNYSKVS